MLQSNVPAIRKTDLDFYVQKPPQVSTTPNNDKNIKKRYLAENASFIIAFIQHRMYPRNRVPEARTLTSDRDMPVDQIYMTTKIQDQVPG